MFNEIIKRLRDIEDDKYEGSGSPSLCGEAADEIDQLRAKVAELEKQVMCGRRLLDDVLECMIVYHDDGTPVLSDELADRCNDFIGNLHE